MIEALLALLPGGKLTAAAGGIAVVLLALFGVWRNGREAGRSEGRKRREEAYERELERLGRAARARDRAERDAGGDGVYEDDGYRRD